MCVCVFCMRVCVCLTYLPQGAREGCDESKAFVSHRLEGNVKQKESDGTEQGEGHEHGGNDTNVYRGAKNTAPREVVQH